MLQQLAPYEVKELLIGVLEEDETRYAVVISCKM